MAIQIDNWPNPRKPLFVSFGDDTYVEALNRIRSEVKYSRFFGDVRLFTPKDLSYDLRMFCENNRADFGYGFYLWKPYVVNQVASNPEFEGRVVFWIDSGCWINRFGMAHYLKYLEAISEEKPFVVFERTGHAERRSVKRDVFHHLGAEEFIDTPPLMAGVFGFRVTAVSREVIAHWYKECAENTHLIDQTPSATGDEYPGFERNRNDQGVFSLLLKKYKCYTSFPAEHILPEEHPSYLDLSPYPFIAMRDQTFFK
jgi:hypothetical protein